MLQQSPGWVAETFCLPTLPLVVPPSQNTAQPARVWESRLPKARQFYPVMGLHCHLWNAQVSLLKLGTTPAL